LIILKRGEVWGKAECVSERGAADLPPFLVPAAK
jgi:hypothetical protein